MASIDLKDAYLHIPIGRRSQKFLRLALRLGDHILHLQFKAPPYGLLSAPCIFKKVIVRALVPLSLKDIAVIPYIDSLLFLATTEEKLWKKFDVGIQPSWEFMLDLKHSEIQFGTCPGGSIFLINLVEQKIFLTREKIQLAMAMLHGGIWSPLQLFFAL